jgi:hypothetical protein
MLCCLLLWGKKRLNFEEWLQDELKATLLSPRLKILKLFVYERVKCKGLIETPTVAV